MPLQFIMAWLDDYHEIEEFIEGKNVALVGNAKSIFDGTGYGSFIDKHEIVIRMNFGFPFLTQDKKYLNPRYLGKKTTLVFAANAVRLILSNSLHGYPGYKQLVHLSGNPDVRNETWKEHSHKFPSYPVEYWESLKNVLTSRPSAGIMAIDILERSNPLKVNIIGFDWKDTPTYYNESETKWNPVGPHDWVKERRYIVSKVKQLGWDIL